jgi:hypothetical protein
MENTIIEFLHIKTWSKEQVVNKTLRVHIDVVNESGEVIDSKVINEKEIIHPRNAGEFGYNQAEQLSLLDDIQQSLLDNQADFLK